MFQNPETAPAVQAMRATADYLEAKGLGGDSNNFGHGETREGLVTRLRAEAQKLERDSANWPASGSQLGMQNDLKRAVNAMAQARKSPIDGIRRELLQANLLGRAERGEHITMHEIDEALAKAQIPGHRCMQIKHQLRAAGIMVIA